MKSSLLCRIRLIMYPLFRFRHEYKGQFSKVFWDDINNTHLPRVCSNCWSSQGYNDKVTCQLLHKTP